MDDSPRRPAPADAGWLPARPDAATPARPRGDRPSKLDAVAGHAGVSANEVVGLAAVLVLGLLVLAVLVWWSPSGGDAGRGQAPGDVSAPAAAADGALVAGEVVVHVSGAVMTPGVVTLPTGSRVADAVAAAGGALVEADLGALNLARVLNDGEQVRVPLAGEPSAEAAAVTSALRADGRLDLNLADAQELETLPGIGPALAARIVGWRDANGPFSSTGQLREVPGIGERTYQALADLVVV